MVCEIFSSSTLLCLEMYTCPAGLREIVIANPNGCEPLYCTSFPRRHDIFATFPALLTPVQWAKYLFYKVAYQTVRSPISLRSVFLQLPVSLLSPLTFALAQMIPTPKISVSKHPRQLQEWFNICDLSLTLVYTVPVSPC